MKNNRIILVAFGLMISLIASAQKSLPTTTVGNKEYYYYQVDNKETVHGISQKTGVPVATIVEYNPDANTELNKGQLLLFPVAQNPASKSTTIAVPADGNAMVYTIGDGEDIYTVAKKFNTTIEGLLNANISITPDKYIPGTKVKVVPNSAQPFAYEATVYHFQNYTVDKNDSFYSIAKRHGISEETLQNLNPATKKLKKGKPIVVPVTAKVTRQGNMSTITVDELQSYYHPRINNIYAKLVEEQRSRVCNVGIILPFQLHKSDAPKQAYLYTDFLKGFMIAMDSVGSKATRKINVKVYDTQHNLNVTDSLLALPEMRNLNLIIAPGEPQQLERINAFAKRNNIDVLNCFSTKNDDYRSNSNVLAVNTPTPIMVANLTKWFTTRFNDCKVVYLEDTSSDATEIFENIKKNLKTAGVECISIKVNSELSFNEVSNVLDPGTNYVFIPSNSTKGLLKRIIPALKQTKEERFDCDINLLGHPEYVLYLKDYQNDLMSIDTYMFSRFFNSKGFRTRNIENSYKKWYGGSMLESYPHMGLLGFDTGCYIINALGMGCAISAETEVHKGIQTGFKFNHTDGYDGLINQAITLVHFSTDKKIESFVATDR